MVRFLTFLPSSLFFLIFLTKLKSWRNVCIPSTSLDCKVVQWLALSPRSGLNPSQVLSMWRLHVLLLRVLLFSVHFVFSPQSKNMPHKFIGDSKGWKPVQGVPCHCPACGRNIGSSNFVTPKGVKQVCKMDEKIAVQIL